MGADNNPSHFKGDDLPVERVSWNDVQEFLARLNEKTGGAYRLPTEAEWEFAAQGGSQSKGYRHSGGDKAGEVSWYSSNSNNRTHSVGTKNANELGVYDMSGNVSEWVSDWRENYDDSPRVNPWGGDTGSVRVFRGGGWNDDARNARVSNRFSAPPSYREFDLGFRLAREGR
jgi:formylglycine-generating enzyme required for sulfatase activity